MNDLLREIVAATRETLRQRRLDEVELARAAAAAVAGKPRFRFAKALHGGAPLIIAEIKSASPTAGLIVDHPNVEEIARSYARGGTAAISVVTEPRFFRGSLAWLASASHASGLPVLMKDFIVEKAQLLEAIAAGADAVLLLASLLEADQIRRFIEILSQHSRDALVEVHDEAELTKAIEAGARIIGVNNRDLRDFSVDLATAERLAPMIPSGTIKVVESGIKTREDVERLHRAGYRAFLVGESLLRQPDREQAVRDLIWSPLVKICGITRPEDALAAVDAGASFVGFVFAERSPRQVGPRRARGIRDLLQDRVAVVGVFRNQPADLIRRIADDVQLDYVQLHGSETADDIARMPRPVIKAVPVGSAVPDCSQYERAEWLLFDASSPGSGTRFDWSALDSWDHTKKFFLAGGLAPENVAEAVRRVRPAAIDVSSGVEISHGIKDPEKIRLIFSALR